MATPSVAVMQLPAEPYPANPVAIPTIVPSVAPLESPISVGSANGFLKIPWASAPAIAIAAPITTAPRARGKRTSQTVAASTDPPLPISDKTEE